MTKENMMNMIPEVEEQLLGIHVKPVEVMKDGRQLYGLSAMYGDICPTMYFNDLPEDTTAFFVGRFLDKAMKEVKINPKDLEDPLYVEYNIEIQLTSAEHEDEFKQRDIWFKPYFGMLAYFSVECFADENGVGSFKVTNSYLKHMGLSVDDLWENAGYNMCESYTFKTMVETLMEVMPGVITDAPDEDSIYILTNKKKIKGAGLMACDSLLYKIWEKVGNFYILPSSVHELIIVPDNGDESNHITLRNMVEEVNSTIVSYEDKLSDDIFCYDGNRLLIA